MMGRPSRTDSDGVIMTRTASESGLSQATAVTPVPHPPAPPPRRPTRRPKGNPRRVVTPVAGAPGTPASPLLWGPSRVRVFGLTDALGPGGGPRTSAKRAPARRAALRARGAPHRPRPRTPPRPEPADRFGVATAWDASIPGRTRAGRVYGGSGRAGGSTVGAGVGVRSTAGQAGPARAAVDPPRPLAGGSVTPSSVPRPSGPPAPTAAA